MEKKELYTVQEVAKIIQLSEKTTYKLIAEEKIKAKKIGGRFWRIPRAEIEKLLNIEE